MLRMCHWRQPFCRAISWSLVRNNKYGIKPLRRTFFRNLLRVLCFFHGQCTVKKLFFCHFHCWLFLSSTFKAASDSFKYAAFFEPTSPLTFSTSFSVLLILALASVPPLPPCPLPRHHCLQCLICSIVGLTGQDLPLDLHPAHGLLLAT